MSFDTLIKPPCPPKGETATLNEAPFGGLGALGRPVGTSLDDAMAPLALKLIEFYGEGFRTKVNHFRAARGLDPL